MTNRSTLHNCTARKLAPTATARKLARDRVRTGFLVDEEMLECLLIYEEPFLGVYSILIYEEAFPESLLIYEEAFPECLLICEENFPSVYSYMIKPFLK